MAIQL